ncbi:peptidoglycan DD-metalloendopeptidase family protein [Nitriliruptoraceae bacterium ZYF776]|nr:peptidoglycan DD-metalloendopeptidase family protein [Profundirhabdus halotolerans]
MVGAARSARALEATRATAVDNSNALAQHPPAARGRPGASRPPSRSREVPVLRRAPLSRSAPLAAPALVATLLVALAAALLPVTAAGAQARPAHEQVLDLTFPVDPTRFDRMTDTYHADRDGGARKHKATDIGGRDVYGERVYAVVAGTVEVATGLDGPVPSYGWMLRIRGDDGRAYVYIHLGDQRGPASEAYAPGIARGTRVVRGQHIGYVGHSGNASPSWPHLHLEIHDAAVTDPYGTNRINPFPSLQAALDRGDLPTAQRVAWFVDVPREHTHAAGIEAIAHAGITTGCAPSRYCPTPSVTRAQMATFLRNALDLPDAGAPTFADVPAGHPHARGIAAVAAAGIAGGKRDGRFDPNAPVRRDQMATFLANAKQLEGDAARARFPDVDPASVHAAAVDAIASDGITAGRPDGRYDPAGEVSRAQMASFIARAERLL